CEPRPLSDEERAQQMIAILEAAAQRARTGGLPNGREPQTQAVPTAAAPAPCDTVAVTPEAHIPQFNSDRQQPLSEPPHNDLMAVCALRRRHHRLPTTVAEGCVRYVGCAAVNAMERRCRWRLGGSR